MCLFLILQVLLFKVACIKIAFNRDLGEITAGGIPLSGPPTKMIILNRGYHILRGGGRGTFLSGPQKKIQLSIFSLITRI